MAESSILTGKNALVTGARLCQGIGFAIAEALAREGAGLAITGRRSNDEAAEAVARLESHGGLVLYRATDLTRPDEITAR